MKRTEFLNINLKQGKILNIGNLQWGGVAHKALISQHPKSVFYGIDIVDQKSIGQNFPNQYIGSCVSLPFEDNFFDTVYAGQVIEHVWEPKTMLDECYRVLKKGGVIVIDTPNVYALSRMIRYFIKGKDVIIGNPEHKMFFSRAMLENMFLESGFGNLKFRTDNYLAFKSKLLTFPDIKPFTYAGECIFMSATK